LLLAFPLSAASPATGFATWKKEFVSASILQTGRWSNYSCLCNNYHIFSVDVSNFAQDLPLLDGCRLSGDTSSSLLSKILAMLTVHVLVEDFNFINVKPHLFGYCPEVLEREVTVVMVGS
jgi:hypothetical protein